MCGDHGNRYITDLNERDKKVKMLQDEYSGYKKNIYSHYKNKIKEL